MCKVSRPLRRCATRGGDGFAQTATQGRGPEPTGGTGFPVGPLHVFPGIDLAQGYDDNLFWTPSNKTSSAFTVVSPYVRAEAKSGPNRYDATLRIANGRFWNSSRRQLHRLLADRQRRLVFDGRTGLKLRAEFRHGHDPRGSTDRVFTSTPDEYNNFGLDGVFRYGAPGAQGRIEIDAGAFARRYTNNHDTTDVLQPQYLAGGRHLLLARHAAHRGPHAGAAHQTSTTRTIPRPGQRSPRARTATTWA